METRTLCINGILQMNDIVLSTIDSEYPCMVGRVTKIIPVWSQEHNRESLHDNIVVDFRQNYGDARIREIEESFSALTGTPRKIHECGLESLNISPDCLIRISDADMGLFSYFLKDEKYALVFAYRTIRRMQYQKKETPELRPVRGQHYEEKKGQRVLIPFNCGWFHRWGSLIEETENGKLENTIAIVEMPDGVVRTVYPNHMEFIDVDDKKLF